MEFDKFIEKFNADRENLLKPLCSIAKENNLDALEILSTAFLNVGISMCGADRVVDVEEAKIIALLGKIFPSMQSISPESWFNSMEGKSEDEWVDIFSRGRQRFGAVYLLETYDSENGTKHAETLKQLLFEFALTMASADGEISPEEMVYLQDLKQNIYKK